MTVQSKIHQLEEELHLLRASLTTQMPNMVTIEDQPYSVSETPITFGQWEVYALENELELPPFPISPRPSNWRDYPVINVNWYECNNYAKWLSVHTNQDYRLPTEEEFKYFCGDHLEGNHKIAVYGEDQLQPVKTKEPNKYGLYDCLGLVWEWMQDEYD